MKSRQLFLRDRPHFTATGTQLSLTQKGQVSLNLTFLTSEPGITILLPRESMEAVNKGTPAENRGPGKPSASSGCVLDPYHRRSENKSTRANCPTRQSRGPAPVDSLSEASLGTKHIKNVPRRLGESVICSWRWEIRAGRAISRFHS